MRVSKSVVTLLHHILHTQVNTQRLLCVILGLATFKHAGLFESAFRCFATIDWPIITKLMNNSSMSSGDCEAAKEGNEFLSVLISLRIMLA